MIPPTLARHVFKLEAAVLLQPLDRLVQQILLVGVELSKLGVNCEWNGSVFPQAEHQMCTIIFYRVNDQGSPVRVSGDNGSLHSWCSCLTTIYEDISLQYVGIWRGLPLADPLLDLSCQTELFLSQQSPSLTLWASLRERRLSSRQRRVSWSVRAIPSLSLGVTCDSNLQSNNQLTHHSHSGVLYFVFRL